MHKGISDDGGISMVTKQRLLGGVIGDEVVKIAYVKRNCKVQKWQEDVDCFSRIAASQPQAAYIALVKSMRCEWNYLQQIVLNCM